MLVLNPMELLSHLFQVSPKSPPILIVKFQMLKQDSYWFGKPSDVPVTKDANVGHCSENMYIISNILQYQIYNTFQVQQEQHWMSHKPKSRTFLRLPENISGGLSQVRREHTRNECVRLQSMWVNCGGWQSTFFPQVSTTGCTQWTQNASGVCNIHIVPGKYLHWK